MTKKRRKLKPLGRTILICLEVCLAVVFLFSSYMAYQAWHMYKEAGTEYEEITETAVIRKEVKNDNTDTVEIDDSVDFEALEEINPDIVAWITLEDSMINYPVVQGEDNAYYLEHLFTRKVNHLGCVFMDYRTAADFSDYHTPLYAHHSQNGAMFAGIEKYKAQSFYETHKKIRLQTPAGEYTLEPYTGLVLNAEVDFLQLNFNSPEEFVRYANQWNNDSTFASGITITEDDRIVTLITCTADYENARYALFCRLTEN
ncbi:MAG: class B sortase [Solobacterium sp.]|nr:class B sortase [Solobacterium sp.]